MPRRFGRLRYPKRRLPPRRSGDGGDVQFSRGSKKMSRSRAYPSHGLTQTFASTAAQRLVVSQVHPLHELIRVLRRRSDTQAHAERAQPPHQAQRIWKRLELAPFDEAFNHRLLPFAKCHGALRGVGYAEILQQGSGAVQAGFTGDVRLVDRGREPVRRVRRRGGGDAAPIRGHHDVERVAPRALMRRGDEHAVHVKDDGAAGGPPVALGGDHQGPMPSLPGSQVWCQGQAARRGRDACSWMTRAYTRSYASVMAVGEKRSSTTARQRARSRSAMCLTASTSSP
jgi:hypothetical protein